MYGEKNSYYESKDMYALMDKFHKKIQEGGGGEDDPTARKEINDAKAPYDTLKQKLDHITPAGFDELKAEVEEARGDYNSLEERLDNMQPEGLEELIADVKGAAAPYETLTRKNEDYNAIKAEVEEARQPNATLAERLELLDRISFPDIPPEEVVIPTMDDLVGKKDETPGATNHGEIFGTYSGSYANKATAIAAHAEGTGTEATNNDAHAEGQSTHATGGQSHAEGYGTIASAQAAHAEGYNAKATADYGAHAEGYNTTASGQGAHAEGWSTTASGGYGAHAEGQGTEASEANTHAEGYNTKATNKYAHAEGNVTKAKGQASHAEGWTTIADGNAAHSEGELTSAFGIGSHSEGYGVYQMPDTITKDSSKTDILSKWNTKTFTLASGNGSHVEGEGNLAIDTAAHAEGYNTIASGIAAHAEGYGTIASKDYQHVQGKYNVEDTNGEYAFVIGNGSSKTSRSNAFAVKWNGDIVSNQVEELKIPTYTKAEYEANKANIPVGSKFIISDDFSTNLETEMEAAKTSSDGTTYDTLADRLNTEKAHVEKNIQDIWKTIRRDHPEDLESIVGIVQSGEAPNVFNIGDQINIPWSDEGTTDYTLPFDIVDFNDVELQDGSIVPGMFCMLHYASPFGVQFDQNEAFYHCDTELAAGSYCFSFGTTWGSNIISGKSYTFTLTKAVPAGGQLQLGRATAEYSIYDTTVDNWRIRVYSDPKSMTPSEIVTVSEGTTGTNLGDINANITYSDTGVNQLHRCVYGYNRWSQSGIRQYLNSDKDKNAWWEPQNVFDRPPIELATKRGFLQGFHEDFLNILKPVKVVTALNTVTDKNIGTSEVTYDKFFLSSLEQEYFEPQITNVEGKYFEYWKQTLGLDNPQPRGTALPEHIRYALNAKTSAQNVRLRSASRGSGLITWYVTSTGYAYHSYAVYSNRFAPCFVIC